jgi:hypothetical protein
MACELGCDREKLLTLRHRLQGCVMSRLDPIALPDAVVDADECDVKATKKEVRSIATRTTRPGAVLTSAADARSPTTGHRWL